jgi:muramidase (phage lysozyme)
MNNGIGFSNRGSNAHLGNPDVLNPPKRNKNVSPIRDIIDAREGQGDYDMIFGGWHNEGGQFADMKRVSSMSMTELDQFTRRNDSRGYGIKVANTMKALPEGDPNRWAADRTAISTPLGRYQIVGNTLRRLRKKLNIPDDAIFTPELQDRLFKTLLEERLSGETTVAGKRKALRHEWEGLRSRMVDGKERGTSDEELDAAIAKFEEGGTEDLISIATAEELRNPPETFREMMNFGGPREGIDLFDGAEIAPQLIQNKRDISVFEEVSAAFALENDLWNGYQLISYGVEKDSFEDDPDFYLTVEMLQNTVLENRLGLVADIRSNEELRFVMNWHQRELKHRAVIEDAGWSGIGWAMFAGIASPISLMPFGAGRAAASGFRGIVKGARAGAAGVAASEVILQANQEYRTATETALGIGGGMILMGALGGLGGAVGRSQFRRASAQADLLMSDRVQAVVDDGEFSYVSNDAVRAEVRRQQEETGNAFFSTGDDANSSARLKTIFRELGDKVKSEEVAGHLDNDRRLLVSGETLNNSRNVIAGFDADIDPKHFKAYHQEQMLDRKAMSEAYEEASTTPIQSSNLTPGQQKLSELETTHAAREERLVRKLTELRERLHNSKLSKGHKDKIWLKKEEQDALYLEMDDINEDLRLGRLRAQEEIAEVKAQEVEEPTPRVGPESDASRLASEERSAQTARQEAALDIEGKLDAARASGIEAVARDITEVKNDLGKAKGDLKKAEWENENATPTNREKALGILNEEQIRVTKLEEELAGLELAAKELGDEAAETLMKTPKFWDDFMAKHEAWQKARKARKLAERERKKAGRRVDDEEIPVDVEEPAAPGRSVEEIEQELAEARFDLDNQRFKPKKKTKKHIAKNAQEAQRVKDLEDELLLASDPLAHGVKELEKKLSQLEARIKKKSVGPKQRAQMLEEMQELREEIIDLVQGESLSKDLRKVDSLEPTAPKEAAPTTAKGSDRVPDSRSRTGTLSRASVNALGEELVEELGFVNGLIREITELFDIQAPTNLQRARMVYLRRQFSEWATEERFLRLQRIYKEHNMDDAEIKQMFNHPLKGSVFEDLLVLEKLEASGDVRSRVDRLILNDKELHGVNHAPDTTPLRSIVGIGPKLEKRLQDYGINDVGELRQYLLNGGEKIKGLHKAIQERILNSEIPGELGEAHIPLNDTPAMRAAEAAWGANNLPLMISTPQGRIMMRSESPEAHRIMANLIITDYKLTRNYQGIEAEEPAELGIKNWHIKISNTVSKIEGLRRQYLLSVRFDSKEVPGRVKTFAKRFTDDEVAARNKVLPQSRWWVEVTKALRHGNQAGLRVPEEAVKYIEQAARLVRDEIWGPASAEFGYLSKELGTKGINPMNYVMRVYDVVKVRQDEPKFRAAMLEDVLKNWNRNYGSAPDAKQIAEIHETVDKWITGILTEPHMRSAPNLAEVSIANRVSFGRGARKRVVEVSDDVLEPYLKHDFRDIISAYMHTRIPDLELKNKFGDVKMKAAFDQLDAGYLARIEKAPETLKEGEQARGLNPAQHLQSRARTKSELQAQWKSDRRDLEAMRDIMRNTYTLPADPYTWKGYTERGMKMLRDINFLRIGGGFAITALGDVGGMVLVNGVSRTMGDLIGELAHGIGRAHESVPMQKADLEALGLSWNDVLNQRAISWSGVGEYGSGGYTALERALSLGSKKMATVSLLQPWTNYMKQIAARSVMSRMIDVAEAVEKGTFKADDLAAISRAYMGKEDLLNMLKLYRAFGGESGGSKWLGIEKWQDTADITNVLEMKRLVRNVIIADTDRAVMTPGVGDSPLFMHSTHGKFLLQFKRFGIAHTQRLLVPAMQGAKADNLIILNVAAISVGLGAMVYSIKEMANKREAPTDIGRIIQEGVVRSDLWGSLGEMDGISSAVTGGSMGFRQALGPDTYHSYHGPNYFDGVASMGLGASYSTIKEGIKAGSGIYDGLTGGGLDDMSAGQMRAFRRMMPYQNLFYLDFIFDYAQNGMEEAGKRTARFKELANGMQSQ